MRYSKDIFELLKSEQAELSGMQARESDTKVDRGKIIHAMSTEGKPLLLIPLAHGDRIVIDQTSKGVTLASKDLEDQGLVARYLAIQCESAFLLEPFGAFCDEVLATLSGDPTDPSGRCLKVLDRWREFFGSKPAEALSDRQLLGLLAELHFLEMLIKRDSSALSSWTGPSGTRADFNGLTCDVEVKATTSREKFSVEIHGFEQLEPAPDKELFLYAERYQRVPSGGDSVPEAAARTSRLTDSPSRFWQLLSSCGYSPEHASAYDEVRFTQVDERCFIVEGNFPRLTPTMIVEQTLIPRVTAVSYSIDITDDADLAGKSVPITDLLNHFLGI